MVFQFGEIRKGYGMRSSGIGGQAVIEGIMMKNGDAYAVAVRKENQTIEILRDEYKLLTGQKKLFSLPFIRGEIGRASCRERV